MAQLFVNNLTLTVAATVSTTQLTLDVTSTSGMPVFQLGDWMYLTLTDIREGGELRWEVVKVTSWSGTTLTVVRGQDGTSAQAWTTGSKASLRVTAADMNELEADRLRLGALETKSPVITLNGDVTGTGTVANLGNVTITATVADDSHNHVISNVDGLQTALDSKADLSNARKSAKRYSANFFKLNPLA